MDEVLQVCKCERQSKEEQHWKKLRNLRRHNMLEMTRVPDFKGPEGEWQQMRLVSNMKGTHRACCSHSVRILLYIIVACGKTEILTWILS